MFRRRPWKVNVPHVLLRSWITYAGTRLFGSKTAEHGPEKTAAFTCWMLRFGHLVHIFQKGKSESLPISCTKVGRLNDKQGFDSLRQRFKFYFLFYIPWMKNKRKICQQCTASTSKRVVYSRAGLMLHVQKGNF